jgi:hypothetical protein
VKVQVVHIHKDKALAERAWRQLVLQQQLSEAPGSSVVRVLGYVEHPGRSLQYIFEDTAGSTLDLMNSGHMSVQEAVRSEMLMSLSHSFRGVVDLQNIEPLWSLCSWMETQELSEIAGVFHTSE